MPNGLYVSLLPTSNNEDSNRDGRRVRRPHRPSERRRRRHRRFAVDIHVSIVNNVLAMSFQLLALELRAQFLGIPEFFNWLSFHFRQQQVSSSCKCGTSCGNLS